LEELVWHEQWDVNRRLRDLGLSIDVLQDAAKAGYLARASCTPNDPPMTPGTDAWSRTVRRLRELLIARGWRKDDPGNYSLTISDEHRLNVVVASGDEATGQRATMPRTKSPKGIYTALAVERNLQPDLFPETLPEAVRKAPLTLQYPTWMFLILIEESAVHAELSYPSEIEDGHVTKWKERIILPSFGVDPAEIDDGPADFGPDFDVDVQRKA
jgi:hypothetical protein